MSTHLHSPLPWVQVEHFEGHSINDADGRHVAYTDWDCDAFATEDAPADQNAEFIVRACNAFDKLVAAAHLAHQLCDLVERWADADGAVVRAELMDEIVSMAQGDTSSREALLLAAGEEVQS